jgi:hypothetical protein
MNQFLLDGASNTDRNTFAAAVNPPLEAVAEFRIQSGLAGAESPQAGGGVVDVVTKSGSRAWHGNAFEFFRNEATDARNYFDGPSAAADLPPPSVRRSLSGLCRCPQCVFQTYEGLRASRPSLPGAGADVSLRSGDFRGVPDLRSAEYRPVDRQRRAFPATSFHPNARSHRAKFLTPTSLCQTDRRFQQLSGCYSSQDNHDLVSADGSRTP